MDLSQSMDATDLRPSRLERAKLKLLDILKARKGGQTALIVYASSAFVVTPLTDDTNTIANLVPTLKTELMPAQGSRAYIAINKAGELLQQAGATHGDTLLITDGLSSKDNAAIEALKQQNHRLSILGVGTTEGGPVPLSGGFLKDAKGAIVIPKLRPQQLQKAALKGGGLFVSMQADDSDIERLDNLFTIKRVKPESETPTLGELQLTADIWQEEGPWLLLLVLPFAALWSRKGWLLCLPVIATVLTLALPEPSYAFELDNLWRSNDQKAMQLFNAGDAKKAAEQFNDNRWKSSAHYRAGDYEKALDSLSEPANSDDFYNQANALAQLGRYPEAVKAYDEALELDANNKDASYNRELVKKAMQNKQNDQQQKGQSGDEQQDQQESDDNSESSDSSGQQQDQPQKDADSEEKNSDAEQQQAQQESSPSPDKQEQNNEDEAKQALQDAQQQEQASEEQDADEQQNEESLSMNEISENEAFDEDQQATEQWLKRIPDDPGQLLRRKFQYQYKRMPNQVADEQPW